MLLKNLLLHLITRRGHTIFVTYISPDLFSCLSLEVDGLVVLSAFVESLLSCLAILWSAFLHVMKLGSTSMITMLFVTFVLLLALQGGKLLETCSYL